MSPTRSEISIYSKASGMEFSANQALASADCFVGALSSLRNTHHCLDSIMAYVAINCEPKVKVAYAVTTHSQASRFSKSRPAKSLSKRPAAAINRDCLFVLCATDLVSDSKSRLAFEQIPRSEFSILSFSSAVSLSTPGRPSLCSSSSSSCWRVVSSGL